MKTKDYYYRTGKTVKKSARASATYAVLDAEKNEIWYNAQLYNFKTKESFTKRAKLTVKTYDESKTVDMTDKNDLAVVLLYNLFVPIYPDRYIVKWNSDASWYTQSKMNGLLFDFDCFREHLTGYQIERQQDPKISGIQARELRKANKKVPKIDVVKYNGQSRYGILANKSINKFKYFVIDIDTSKNINEDHNQTMYNIAVELYRNFYHLPFGSAFVKRMIQQNISNQGVQYLFILDQALTVEEIQANVSLVKEKMYHRDYIDVVSPDCNHGMRLPFDRCRPSVLFNSLPLHNNVSDIAQYIYDDDEELTLDESSFNWMLSWKFVAHNVDIAKKQLEIKEDLVVAASDLADCKTEDQFFESFNCVVKQDIKSTGKFHRNWYSDIHNFMMTGVSGTYAGHSNTTMAYHYLSGVSKLLMAYGHNNTYIVDFLYKSLLIQRFDISEKELKKIVASSGKYCKNLMMDKILKDSPEYCANLLRLVSTGTVSFSSASIQGKILNIIKDINFCSMLKGKNKVEDVAYLVSVVVYKAFCGVGITNAYMRAVIKKNELQVNCGNDYMSCFIAAMEKTGLCHRVFTANSSHLRSRYEIGQLVQDLLADIDSMVNEVASINVEELKPIVENILILHKKIRADQNPALLSCADLVITCAHFASLVEKKEITDPIAVRLKNKFRLTLSRQYETTS